jgi:hypothetical protein
MDLKILGAAIKNLIAMAALLSALVHPCPKLSNSSLFEYV